MQTAFLHQLLHQIDKLHYFGSRHWIKTWITVFTAGRVNHTICLINLKYFAFNKSYIQIFRWEDFGTFFLMTKLFIPRKPSTMQEGRKSFPHREPHSPSLKIGTMSGFIWARYTIAHLHQAKKICNEIKLNEKSLRDNNLFMTQTCIN